MADTGVQGTFDISVEDAGVIAVCKITPDANGETLSLDLILQELKNRGIINGIRNKEITAAFLQISKTGKAVSLTAAEGTPVTPAFAHEIEWVTLDIPDDLAVEAAAAFKRASAPEIFVTKYNRVKKEKTVQKKAKFPFSKQKEETVVEYEKVEKKEKVFINPHIVEKGYAVSGQRLGILAPGKPGKPGKDVFGNIILPDDKVSEYYPGNGVSIERNEIKATVSGFLRRGNNWVDIIPFDRHEWDVFLSKDKNTCLLKFHPGDALAIPPSPVDVLQKAESLGYDKNLLVSAQEIQHLIAEAISAKQGFDEQSISTTEDSFFLVEATPDKLKGLLTIRKHRGHGHPLVLKDVGAAVKASGLKGLDFEKIKSAILEFYKGPEPVLDGYVLCEGTPPGTGEKQTMELETVFLNAKEKEKLLTQIKSADPACFEGIGSLDEFPLENVKDLVPVSKDQRLALIEPATKGDPGVNVFGAQIEGIPGDEMNLSIYENLRIEKNILLSDIDGLLEYAKEDDHYFFRVRPHKDAHVEVSIGADRMTAMVSIDNPQGSGLKLDPQLVESALAAAKVTMGIDNEAILAAVDNARKGEEVQNFTVARGKAPLNPGEGRLEFRIELASGKGVSIDASGRADFRRQDKITNVEKDTLIAEIVGISENAEDGWDISGKPIPAKAQKSDLIVIGQNIEEKLLENGTRQFFSTVQGEVAFEKKRLEVRSVHTVPGDVDMKSGNVKFSGDVHIAGNVASGFVVFSGGKITIGQGVDAALLSAEGFIHIGGGIKGAGKAVVRTKSEVRATFAEQTNILAIADVVFSKACLRCNIKTNGKVILSEDKGSLVGGVIKARRGLSVQNLGSENGIKTSVSFGQNYLVQDQIEAEDRALKKHKDDMLKIDLYMKKMEATGNKAKVDYARQEKLKFMKLIEKRSMRLFTLREKFEEHFPSEVEIRGTLYPGVVFESHGRYHEIDAEKKGVVLIFDPKTGRITEKPLEA